MNIDWIREYCCSLAGATEQVQWGDDLVFKVGGKMSEEFADLTERPGLRPAAYLARAHWVSLETEGVLPRREIERLIRQSHGLVLSKLPKKIQAKILKARTRATRSREWKS